MSSCIDPAAFGPYYWAVIHLACLSEADGLQEFVNSLPGILPCPDCKEHLRENLTKLPFDSKDPFRWSVELHNAVNKRLGKPMVSYEKALEHWKNLCAPKKNQSSINWVFILLGILVVFGMVFR